MANFAVYKETALPGTLQPNSIYLIAPAAKPEYLEIYATNSAGTAHRRILTETDINALISAAIAASGGTTVVADIAARNALTPVSGSTALVLDATGDATVASGAATYVWDGSAWVKISEAESLDLVLDWESLTGKPTSTAAQIDTAVTNSHTHTNKTELDKIGEAGGLLTYNGSLPKIAWDSANW